MPLAHHRAHRQAARGLAEEPLDPQGRAKERLEGAGSFFESRPDPFVDLTPSRWHQRLGRYFLPAPPLPPVRRLAKETFRKKLRPP